MYMIDYIKKLIDWISHFWTKLPASAKDKVIDSIVEVFGVFFRAYFQDAQEENPSE